MKKALSLFLSLCLVLSLLTVAAFAAPTRDGLADGYYLIGDHNSWSVDNFTEADRFHPSLGDANEFVLETTLTQDKAFKVVRVENGAVAKWYPEGTGNDYVVDADHAGPAIIYFRNSYWNDWAANGGYVWVGGKPAVAYVDENGETQTCTDYTTANFAGETWTGWVVVTENTSFGGYDFDSNVNDFVGPRIQVVGDVCLILEDGKTLTDLSGIHIPSGSSLKIYGQQAGTGALIAGELDNPCFSGHAAIGADSNEVSTGTLTVNGGKLYAYAGDMGAGIGGSFFGNFGLITINGGEIAAYGNGDCGDGIGAGDCANACPNIEINGGKVTAVGCGSGAGIGCYYDATLTINGGEITATGGTSDGGVGGAGIGGNYANWDAGSIVINGGTIVARGGDGTIADRGGAGIGGAYGGNGGSITINGGAVTATGGEQGGAGIGPGAKTYVFPSAPGEVSTVVINGGQVTASAANAAGIGFSMVDDSTSDLVEALVKLGWTEQTDFIQASSFAGSVTLDKDFAVEGTDETFAAGAVTDNSTLANKKLIPPAPVVTEPIEIDTIRIFPSISIGIEVLASFSVRSTDLSAYESWYIEVSKLDADGNPTETKRFGEGQEGTVSGSFVYKADYRDITAKEFGVPFTASIHAFDANGQEYYSSSVSYTIRDYIIGELLNEDNPDANRTLAADLLNYGAAAQAYFDFDEENLVNTNLSAEAQAAMNRFATAGEAPAVLVNNANSANIFTSVSVMNRVVLTLSIRGFSSANAVQIEIKNHETGAVKEVIDAEKLGSIWRAKYSGFEAEDMRTAFDFTVLADGAAAGTPITWSVEGYVREARLNEDSTEEELALLNALLHYVDAAADADFGS